ncbi:MAG TPA: 1,4-alpha-glucan branching protein GlgB [Hydrogenophaga sp.]|uniref:1,4-alpha-glucan branching protein GlgB n=1 Tax=Hydrogenophaga sp. TaxID=1904254 RepID=UPI002BBD342F|nr:1,4-alpha-glucan branching protein GlgB [Hydrogenophaga sp.]HMN93669.1 1,4-alpha-glucan branching protein GlgB [Hydrogenophaga sp.]
MEAPSLPLDAPWIGETDAWLLAEGKHLRPWQKLGAHPTSRAGREGVAFAVWAPSARLIRLTGDFNHWDFEPMHLRPECGIWELFVPGALVGQWYKFEVHHADGSVVLKTDPYARQSELPPGNAARICPPLRPSGVAPTATGKTPGPMAIYEVHAGSWRRPQHPQVLPDWDDLARELVPYAADMGFTHIELLPISEHPFYGSWGYQPTGLYAPSARYGSPEAFARFVEAVHAAGLKLILDWVPAHFPTDEHALARFDGTALYEHADPREGFHRDWNTLIYNFGRHEVKNFLVGNALFWIEQYGVDGLRVDAVASMLYRDYSRPPGEWVPNRDGGRENHEAIAFLQEVHEVLRREAPQAITIAEESTAFPGVTRSVDEGGLGFDHKWNMGWMHDTLAYFALDPVHRSWHHDKLTFAMMYAYSESYVLPLSHDEVVHGKGSLLNKMPGDRWQKLANLRSLYGWMYAHPGKKLLFMGSELAQPSEWDHDHALPWELLEDPGHAGIQRLVHDLNHSYRASVALHVRESDPFAFQWLVVDDASQSVLAFVRHGLRPEDAMLTIANFTPTVRTDYRVGVPHGGAWREVINTDSSHYGGGNVGNHGRLSSDPVGMHQQSWSLSLTLPPLAVLWLQPVPA